MIKVTLYSLPFLLDGPPKFHYGSHGSLKCVNNLAPLLHNTMKVKNGPWLWFYGPRDYIHRPHLGLWAPDKEPLYSSVTSIFEQL